MYTTVSELCKLSETEGKALWEIVLENEIKTMEKTR